MAIEDIGQQHVADAVDTCINHALYHARMLRKRYNVVEHEYSTVFGY